MRRGRVFRRCTSCKKRVKVRRCPCGRGRVTWAFVVDVAAPGEPRDQRTGSGYETEALATAAMNRLQSDRAEGLYVEPSKLTAGQYLRQWIKGLEDAAGAVRAVAADDEDRQPGDERDNTLIGWEVAVRRQLAPRLDHVLLQQLTKAQVRAVYRDVALHGRVRDGGPLAPKSVWNIHLCLHRALKDAIADGLIRINPASGARRRPKNKPSIKFWVGAQLAAFLAGVPDVRDRTLYRAAGQTGMRLGELLGLRWGDINFATGSISIGQQLTRRRGGGFQYGPPKTRRGLRTIDASPDTLAALRAHLAQQEVFRRAWGDAYRLEEDLVFCREDGGHWDLTQVSKRFTVAMRSVKLPRLRFHDLRHTSAVIGLRELGEWPDETSARLGHSSVAFTLDTYGHLLPKRGKQTAAAFDALLREAKAS